MPDIVSLKWLYTGDLVNDSNLVSCLAVGMYNFCNKSESLC